MTTHHMLLKGPLLLALLALAPQWSTFAQGTAFTYQGQLREAGAPVNAPANFVFGLWDASAAGGQIGAPVALNAVAVSDGLFTVEAIKGLQAEKDAQNAKLQEQNRPLEQRVAALEKPINRLSVGQGGAR